MEQDVEGIKEVPERMGAVQDAGQRGSSSSDGRAVPAAEGTARTRAAGPESRFQRLMPGSELTLVHRVPEEISVVDYESCGDFDEAMKLFLQDLLSMGLFLAYNPWQGFAKELTKLYPGNSSRQDK